MRKIIIFLLLLNCSTSQTNDNSRESWEIKILSNLSLEEVRWTLKNEDFVVYHKQKDIPKPIMDTLTRWSKTVKFANPNQKYQETDLVNGFGNLPSRQLITILKNENYTIFTYNHGGFAHHQHLLWSKMKEDEIVDIWIGSGNGLTNKEKIITFLDQKQEDLNTNILCF